MTPVMSTSVLPSLKQDAYLTTVVVAMLGSLMKRAMRSLKIVLVGSTELQNVCYSLYSSMLKYLEVRWLAPCIIASLAYMKVAMYL